MNRRYIWLIPLLLFGNIIKGQQVINFEVAVTGNMELTNTINIPKISRGYTVWLPDGDIKGMMVFMHARRDTVNREFIIDYALKQQLAVMYVTTDNRLEFFFDKQNMLEIVNYIREVVDSCHIPVHNLLYGGMSLAGTRALKLAIYGQSLQAARQLTPRAIAVCDAPLDMVRFHREMVKAKQLNFNPIAANEGEWVSGYLEANLGGTPSQNLQAYVDYSPWCYQPTGEKYLPLLKGICIRAYTEPDVNWWIENRRKDYYGMNAIDLAGLVNDLRIAGNSRAELITTINTGYSPDGSRHPHNWSIVDEKELVDWFVELLK